MVLLVLYLLIGNILVGITAIRYGTLLFVLGVAVVSWLVFSKLRSDDGESGSVWNAIPDWQYDGRHAESGGLARGEQEQALQEIHDEAEQRNEDIHRK
jgi:hypothetical protein